ncbi:MAG TPA: 2-C-methyl-D-erythritol 4-phosphate cytidylyltransferase [Clostridiales bacterium]|nr:2-C-methyl-D-erythritol 4-phosphate cytidylyltransferase [Clostridiales bacterium]
MDKVLVYSVTPPLSGDKRAAAIIAAAGSFTRMEGIQKQLVLLDGTPAIAHTIKAFQEAENIREIVVVARTQDFSEIINICRQYTFDKVSTVVSGGGTRQQSVFNGINCAQADTKFFAIHDGARPLVTSRTIDRVVESAWNTGAAIAAVPCKDTVKMSDNSGFVAGTPDRKNLWIAQTPQVFERELYLRAAKAAAQNGEDFTDDSQLVERLGVNVCLVESEYENIKITTPGDIAVAHSIIEFRKKS